MSQRQAAKHFNISRDSVAKMLSYSTPPGYQRQITDPAPEAGCGFRSSMHWLREDLKVPRKQRHTAKRVFDRLRDEHAGSPAATRSSRITCASGISARQEMFVPLAHPPGHAQADFGEAMVVIGGVEQKAHFFVLDLPHSDACYVRAYPAAVAEAWVDGHVHAFAFFGAVPQSIVYDNDRCLVAKILPDGTRKRATLFSGFLSHYLIRDRYGRPARATTRGMSRGWSAMPGATSWCRSRSSRHGRRSTPGWRSNAASASATGCAARARRSASGCSAIWRPCSHCRRHPSMPATRPAGG
jgi:transposase